MPSPVLSLQLRKDVSRLQAVVVVVVVVIAVGIFCVVVVIIGIVLKDVGKCWKGRVVGPFVLPNELHLRRALILM